MNITGNLVYFRPPPKLYRIIEFYLFFLFLAIFAILIYGIMTQQIILFVDKNGQPNVGNTILLIMFLILTLIASFWAISVANDLYSSFKIYDNGISNPITMLIVQSKEIFIPFSKIVKYEKAIFTKGLYGSIRIYTPDNKIFDYHQDYNEKKDSLKILEQSLKNNHIRIIENN